jgi:preprotein translocase subunit SecE
MVRALVSKTGCWGFESLLACWHFEELGEHMKKIARYFKESWNELKKVSWPKRGEVVHYTWVVIISTLVFALVLGLVDIGIGQLMDLIF